MKQIPKKGHLPTPVYYCMFISLHVKKWKMYSNAIVRVYSYTYVFNGIILFYMYRPYRYVQYDYDLNNHEYLMMSIHVQEFTKLFNQMKLWNYRAKKMGILLLSHVFFGDDFSHQFTHCSAGLTHCSRVAMTSNMMGIAFRKPAGHCLVQNVTWILLFRLLLSTTMI